jgi:hypothetical protein
VENIQAFWNKFLEIRQQLLQDYSEMFMDELLSALRKIDPRLYYHLAEWDDGVDIFFSAEGYADLMPVLERLKACAPNVEGWGFVTAFEALIILGKRNLTVFPSTENGDVLYQMAQDGDDLSISRDVDFSVVFNNPHQVSQFVENFSKNGCQISIGKPSGILRRKITVTISCKMFPTHDSISSFETKLGLEAKRFGGRNDGWGCFVQK